MFISAQHHVTALNERRRGVRSLLGALGLAGILLLSACSGDEMSSGGAEPASADDVSGESGRVAPEQERAAPQVDAGTQTAVQPRRIHRGEVSVVVEDLSRSAQQVQDLAAGLGGYVSDESMGISQASYDSRYDDGAGSEGDSQYRAPLRTQPGEARIVLRVPPQETTEAMNQIAALGTETGRWRSSTNVELTMVDLESRVTSQTQAVEQAQALMERAQSLSDIVMLENEVNTRTSELESLKARRASLNEQTEMATVTAVLMTAQRTEKIDEAAGFMGGLRSGWNALMSSVSVLLTVAGALLPFAAVGLVVGYPLYRLIRSRRATRRSGPAMQAPSGPGHTPAGPPTATPAQG